MTRFAGLIAAAGKSTRMGSPKSLLRFDDKDVFVTRIARVFLDAGITSLYVTAPPDKKVAADIRKALNDRGLQEVVTVDNNAYARGLVGSLDTVERALRAAAPVAGLIFTPTDAPFVTVAHVTALIAAIDGGASAARLRVDAQPAHPAAIGHDLFADIATAPTPRALMDHGVVDVPADDPRLLAQINTPADYARHFPRSAGDAL